VVRDQGSVVRIQASGFKDQDSGFSGQDLGIKAVAVTSGSEHWLSSQSFVFQACTLV
jgi:hypothetical protein